MKPDAATNQLIMRAVEERLAALDALIHALKAQVTEDPREVVDGLARRFFLLEQRIVLLEEAIERWGLGPRRDG